MFYDTEWNERPEYDSHHHAERHPIRKPKTLKQMVEYAKILSEDFPQVRVDFYEVNGNLYFGELTFTSQGGYMNYISEEYLQKWGDMVKL